MIITDRNWNDVPQEYGILPRYMKYGSTEARENGMIPVSDSLDVLVPEDEFKERIQEANEKQMMAIHYLRDSGAKAHSQGGTNYCWAYGISECLEALRPMENQEYIRLAPATMGWIVNWRNKGNYLSSAIKGCYERGVASSEFAKDGTTNYKSFKDGWQEDAMKHRPHEWTDTDSANERRMVQQCVSLLVSGLPLYIAYNWWGHALMMAGVEWDETQKYNLRWIAWNSHNDGRIELTGSRGVPDEAYAPRVSTIS
jgi:hypothetical protein